MNYANMPEQELLTDRKGLWDLLRFPNREPENTSFLVRLAWPVYGWRAVVPKPYDKKTDPMMRALIRLFAAGQTKVGDIARLLGINEMLAAYILQQCLEDGYLDKKYNLTQNGKNVVIGLEPDDCNSASLETGWIFRDAITGDVMPMFYRGSLPEANKRGELIVLPYNNNTNSAERPTLKNILGSLKLYGKLARDEAQPSSLSADYYDPEGNLEIIDWEQVEDSEDDKDQLGFKAPDVVQIINYHPEKLDLPVYFYTTKENPQEWLVRSPFGLSGGWWFKRRLEWAIPRNAFLQQQVDSWINKALEEKPKYIPANVEMDIESQVIQDFPALENCVQLKNIREQLVQAYEADYLYRQNPSNLDVVAIRYCRVLEALTITFFNQISRPVIKQMEKQSFSYTVLELAQDLNVGYPERLKQIVPEVRKKYDSLTGFCLFLLLHAHYDKNSKFYAALQTEPELMILLDKVVVYRNKNAAHYDEGKKAAKEEIYQELKKAAHQAINVLTTHYC